MRGKMGYVLRVRFASFFAGAAAASALGLYLLHKDYKIAHEAITQQESPMPDPSELFTNVYVKDRSDHSLQDTHVQSYLHPFISEPSDAQGPMEAAKERDSEDEKQCLGEPVFGLLQFIHLMPVLG